MKYSRQEYWSGLPFPSPGDLPNPGMEPVSPGLAGRFFYHCAIYQQAFTIPAMCQEHEEQKKTRNNYIN